jgi:hypothetical protein
MLLGIIFKPGKDYVRRDPLSPILFNIVADMLAILIARAKDEGKVGRPLPH